MTRAVQTALAGAGGVLQVVQATNSTLASTTSSSYVTTGVSASITPTASTSKILVLAEISFQIGTAAGAGIGFALYRGTTSIWEPAVSSATGPYGGFYVASNGDWRSQIPIHYLDSPATTSSTTYNIYFATRGGNTGTINNTDSTAGKTSIVLLEIAG